MTQEDKTLLLHDLCARLPYGVICDIYNDTCTIKEKLLFGGIARFADDTICVRPYLRSLSSMTEEEKEEYHTVTMQSQDCSFENSESATTMVNDWLLSKHFDTRGLIKRGLAIEVTKENNPYERAN